MLAPAPDLAAFAMKLALLFAHGVEPEAVAEEHVEAALGDVGRLGAAVGGREANGTKALCGTPATSS